MGYWLILILLDGIEARTASLITFSCDSAMGVTGGQIPRHVLMFTDAAALFLLSSVLCFMIISLLFKRILLTLQPSGEDSVLRLFFSQCPNIYPV